jgi:hypothetical protein
MLVGLVSVCEDMLAPLEGIEVRVNVKAQAEAQVSFPTATCSHQDKSPGSVARDETLREMLCDVVLGSLRVLMNLTHQSPQGCSGVLF